MESHPDSLEFLLLKSSLCTAQRFSDAIKRDSRCPSSCKEMPLGCPLALVGRAAPSSAAAVTSACANPNHVQAQHRQSLPLCPCITGTSFPFCRECRALQSAAPGRGCSFLCFCISPPSELLRPSGICHVIPQAGTGMICACGSHCRCPSRWALALQRQPSQRLASPRSPGSLTPWSREGRAAVRALPNPPWD